jgi:hypothetical protein
VYLNLVPHVTSFLTRVHTLLLKIAVFWVVAPCSLVEVYQRFRGPCCLQRQGATTQKTAIFILTAVRTSNPTHVVPVTTTLPILEVATTPAVFPQTTHEPYVVMGNFVAWSGIPLIKPQPGNATVFITDSISARTT